MINYTALFLLAVTKLQRRQKRFRPFHTQTHTLSHTLRQIALTFDPLMLDVTSRGPAQVIGCGRSAGTTTCPAGIQRGSRWTSLEWGLVFCLALSTRQLFVIDHNKVSCHILVL